jgi:predicted DNA-binding transcriptional regulator AlpA
MAGIILVISEEDAAKALDLGRRTLQRLRLDGGGPAYIQLAGRRVGYTEEALQAWVRSRQRASTADATVKKAA